jgi:hypothetical protein
VLVDIILVLLIIQGIGGLRTDQKLMSLLLLLIHLKQLRGADTYHFFDWLVSHHVHLIKHVLLLGGTEDLLGVFTRSQS